MNDKKNFLKQSASPGIGPVGILVEDTLEDNLDNNSDKESNKSIVGPWCWCGCAGVVTSEGSSFGFGSEGGGFVSEEVSKNFTTSALGICSAKKREKKITTKLLGITWITLFGGSWDQSCLWKRQQQTLITSLLIASFCNVQLNGFFSSECSCPHEDKAMLPIRLVWSVRLGGKHSNLKVNFC